MRGARVPLLGVLLLGVATAVVALGVASRDQETTELRDGLSLAFGGRTHTAAGIQVMVRSAGLDASVEELPVGPSLVGRVLFARSATGTGNPVETEGRPWIRRLSLPEKWNGRLLIMVGRNAQQGERYSVLSNALDPGEPLACKQPLGRTVHDIRPLLAAFTVITLGPSGPQPLRQPTDPAVDSQYVYDIRAQSATELVITIQPSRPTSRPHQATC